MTLVPEVFVDVVNPGAAGPQAIAHLTEGITTTPAAGTVEQYTVDGPAPAGYQQSSGELHAAVDGEIMGISCSSMEANSTTWSFTRGVGGTIAAHNNGAPIYPLMPAAAYKKFVQADPGTVMGQTLTWNTLNGVYTPDDGVHSPWNGWPLHVVNLFTDPRATKAANWTTSAPTLSPPPIQPVYATGSGGTLSAGTYSIASTYVTAAGETLTSYYSPVAVTAGQTVSVFSPAGTNEVTGWNCYVLIGATWYKQNSTPIQIGTNFVLSANPVTTNGTMPNSGTATPAGTTAAPVNVADGYQQQANPLSCAQVTQTPATGSYSSLGTRVGQLIPTRWGQTISMRAAGKVNSVAGGGAWHVALVLVWYTTGFSKVAESTIWSSPKQAAGVVDSTALAVQLGGSNGWFTMEGFENQHPLYFGTPYGVLWAEPEMRVYNDSGTPGAIQHSMTELVGCLDPDTDVPYYCGGDISAGITTNDGLGYSDSMSCTWVGGANNADNAQSIGLYDPLTIYPHTTYQGFNNFNTPTDGLTESISLKLMREVGTTISRENVLLSDTEASPIHPDTLTWLKKVANAGIKIIMAIGFPISNPLLDSVGTLTGGVYSGTLWPTSPANQATAAQWIVNAIGQMIAAGIPLGMIYGLHLGNEPNNPAFAGTAGSTSYSTLVGYTNAVYSAVHAAYPSVKVLGGCLSAGGWLGQPASADTWLSEMYSLSATYDYLDIHPYPTMATVGNPVTGYSYSSGPPYTGWAVNSGLFVGFDATLKAIKDVQSANGDSGRMITMTETGFIAYRERNQGRAYDLLLGRIRRDPQVLFVCTNGLAGGTQATSSTTTPSTEWTGWDGKTLRRRPYARRLARQRGLPMPPIDPHLEIEPITEMWRPLVNFGKIAYGSTTTQVAAFSGFMDPTYPTLYQAAAAGASMWRIDPADMAMPGKTLLVRVKGFWEVNAVAPGTNLTFTLEVVTGWTGASGVAPAPTTNATVNAFIAGGAGPASVSAVSVPYPITAVTEVGLWVASADAIAQNSFGVYGAMLEYSHA